MPSIQKHTRHLLKIQHSNLQQEHTQEKQLLTKTDKSWLKNSNIISKTRFDCEKIQSFWKKNQSFR